MSIGRRKNYAANSTCWALGAPQANGFHVRKVVWGLLMAQTEVRKDEEIRAATILVERAYRRRRKILPDPIPPIDRTPNDWWKT